MTKPLIEVKGSKDTMIWVLEDKDNYRVSSLNCTWPRSSTELYRPAILNRGELLSLADKIHKMLGKPEMIEEQTQRVLEEIGGMDADQFTDILKGISLIAQETAEAEPVDPAWFATATQLYLAAQTVKERRGN